MAFRALILYGYGINCDRETSWAFHLAGAKPERVHLNELIEGRKKLSGYQAFVLPGGFSFGDDISAGKVMALKIKTHLADSLSDFIRRGGLVLGICNGFQVLVKMGLLPDFNSGYPWNPNGSEMNIAGICDKTGRIFGLMPHPEGFLFPQNHPRWTRGKISRAQGIEVFKNGVKYGKM